MRATGGARRFRFGVVAPLRTDLPAWRDQVRRIADNGFSTLLMPDVQQWQPAPGPTLAVAATLADVRVGTWVYASPLRTPWSLAWEAHSLSVLTEGRFEMGIGTGRPGIEDELRQLGLPVVTPGERLSQVRDAVTLLSLSFNLFPGQRRFRCARHVGFAGEKVAGCWAFAASFGPAGAG